MRIGILTVHRAINVGAVLQTYALQELLKHLGHDVQVIDYWQADVERKDRSHIGFKSWLRLCLHFHPRSALLFLKRRNEVMKRRAGFDNFINKWLNLTDSCTKDNIPDDFDAYVIGSDQLWNRNILLGHNDLVFWGNFKHKDNSKIISYAISTSVADIASNDQDFITSSLRNFSFISLREKETVDYFNQHYTLLNPTQLVLDPTLTANRAIWENIRAHRFDNEKYVLVYAARSYEKDPMLLMRKARALADELGCDVKTLEIEHVPDFVDIIANAQYVISSSFHGIAFSLIFNRPLFAVLYGDEQDARYKNLLHLLNAEKLLTNINDEFHPTAIDYTPINETLDIWKKRSIEFVKQLDS